MLKILTETLLKEIVPIVPEAACDSENCSESCSDMYVHCASCRIFIQPMRVGHWRKSMNAEKESRNRNSDVAYGTIFRITIYSKCFHIAIEIYALFFALTRRPTRRVSTEFRTFFCPSVSSVFRAKLPKLPRNFAEFRTSWQNFAVSSFMWKPFLTHAWPSSWSLLISLSFLSEQFVCFLSGETIPLSTQEIRQD
jgi:hypothetical protein